MLLELCCFCRVNHKDKNDVYDIGAILLEIILGRQITSQNEVHVSRDLVSLCIYLFVYKN